MTLSGWPERVLDRFGDFVMCFIVVCCLIFWFLLIVLAIPAEIVFRFGDLIAKRVGLAGSEEPVRETHPFEPF